MQTLGETLLAIQRGSWWSGAGILAVVLVICCLLMMLMMGRGMGGKSKDQTINKQSNKTDTEPQQKDESEKGAQK